MARARKQQEPEQPEEVAGQEDGGQVDEELNDQEKREAAREAAGIANQDQENAPVHEQTPQPDTRHFIAQPDVLNEPEGTPAGEGSYDESGEGRSGE